MLVKLAILAAGMAQSALQAAAEKTQARPRSRRAA